MENSIIKDSGDIKLEERDFSHVSVDSGLKLARFSKIWLKLKTLLQRRILIFLTIFEELRHWMKKLIMG